MTILRIACVQLNAQADMTANIAAASALIREAAGCGVTLVSTPEYVSLMDGRGRVMREGAYPEADHPALAAFTELAAKLSIAIHVGSLTITGTDGRPTNRSYVIDRTGHITARYDKINMFDITLADGRELFESRVYAAGDKAVTVEFGEARLGLTICYDLRFPSLFRNLAEAGAQLVLVPSSFLPATGTAHWHALLRARAIDNGVFIAAAAMCGEHGGNRASYGHSLIVDPWGRVLAEANDTPGIITADIELGQVGEMQASNPWLQQPAPFDRLPPANHLNVSKDIPA